MSRQVTESLKGQDSIKRRHSDDVADLRPDQGSGPLSEYSIRRKSSCACGGGCPSCQIKSNDLKVSHPNDPAEIEADQIAERVMRMSIDDANLKSNLLHEPNAIHRKCDACEDEEEGNTETPVIRKEASAAAASTLPPNDAPPSIRNVINSGGHPLDLNTRNFFEPRFGADLSRVRVHTDPAAAQSARSINAKAYTVGSNIVFGSGEYEPKSESGKHLLAHELAHVEQSRKSTINRQKISRQPVKKVDQAPRKGAATPLKQFVQADLVHEIKRDNDTWLLTIDGFSDPDRVKRMIWPESVPAGIRVELEVAITDPIERGWFVLKGVTYDTLKFMEPSIAKLFTDHGLKEEFTPEQIRAGELAYYQSTRETRLDAVRARKRAEIPQLSATQIYDRWKSDRMYFIELASTPGHGLKREQMITIYGRYWGDFEQRAFAKQVDLHKRRLSHTDEFDYAVREEEYARAALSAVVDAHHILRAAEIRKRILTLDELTEFALNSAGFRNVFAAVGMAMGRTGRAGGIGRPRLPKPAPPPPPPSSRPVTASTTSPAPPNLQVIQGGGQRAQPPVTTATSPQPSAIYAGPGGAAPKLDLAPSTAPAPVRHLQSVPMPAPVTTPTPSPIIIPAPAPAPPVSGTANLGPYAAGIGLGISSRTTPSRLPQPDPDTDYDKRRRRGACQYQTIAQQSGRFPCHADFAASLSGVLREMRVTTPELESVDYDAMDFGRKLYEVKTGYRWLVFMASNEARKRIIQRFYNQAIEQMLVAERCGHPLAWYFNDPYVASYFGAENAPFPEYFSVDLPVPVYYVPFDCDADSDVKRI